MNGIVRPARGASQLSLWLLCLLWLAAACSQSPEPTATATLIVPTTAPLVTVSPPVSQAMIQVSPVAGSPGTRVVVAGQGWQPANTIYILLDDLGDSGVLPISTKAQVDWNGRFSAAFTVPANVAWQSLPTIGIVAESFDRRQQASTAFQLLLPTTPTPTEATAGQTPAATPSPAETELLPQPTNLPVPSATPTLPGSSPSPTTVPASPTAQPVATATPAVATATPTVVINNWRGQYYGNPTLSGQPVLVRDDATVNFYWGESAPAANLPADAFSASWSRTLNLEEGVYRFYAQSDDGLRVWLDDSLLIDQWHNGTGSAYQVDRELAAGSHSFRIEYYEDRGSAQLWFWWEKVTTFPDWRGVYWPNRELEGPPGLVRNDANVNFDWGQGAPSNGLPADNFSVRWTRTLRFEEDLYRFSATVDDGLRLYVDDILVIDQWQGGAGPTVSAERRLTAGQHTVRVEYYEGSGEAQVRLWWERPTFYPDWRGEYWANQSLSGEPVLIRNDQQVNFDWQTNAPAAGLPVNGFSARWTRPIEFQPGRYRLNVTADDGVRIYIEGRLVLDQWHDNSGTVTYQVEQALSNSNRVVIEYYENGGTARIRFWYERIGDLPTATPTPANTPRPTLPVSTPPPVATPLIRADS